MFLLSKKIGVLIPITVIALSCIREDSEDCGAYLRFIFDHNMEYADAFQKQVRTVDVFFFSENGRFVAHKHAESTHLTGGNRMDLSGFLSPGTYQIVTVGGMSDRIVVRSTDLNEGTSPSTIDRLTMALKRESGEVSFEFSHAWFGTTVIHYDTNRSIWPVHLIRNTNKFHLSFQNIDQQEEAHPEIPPYTFQIITPEAGAYDHTNQPLLKEVTTYVPFSLLMATEPANTSVGLLNTMRLLNTQEPDSYRLVIRNTATKEKVWSCDLLSLLRLTKPPDPDGKPIPMQEYLDRQGQWNIHLVYKEEKENENGFQAVSIEVNGWIIWLNNIEI